jgi:hypothetical protein
MRSVIALAVVALGVVAASAQDPVQTLPESYLLQFENEWVKVVRVRYAPFAKLPGHAHTAHASAYVYLNDAGPVIFRHVGEKGFTATRPATKAGSFRVFRGIEEIHEVENTSAVLSEFLRVEFKTDPRGLDTLRGRFQREPAAAGEQVERVQFENEQVRITRFIVPPARTLQLQASASEPALAITLSGAEPGAHRWLPPGPGETTLDSGPTTLELLRFDFKTLPVGTR